LPVGWTEEQSAGHYRLRRRADQSVFGFTVGPQGWRRYLQLPKESLFSADRNRRGQWQVKESLVSSPKRALLGVRSCEWQAIQVQDRVFERPGLVDQPYQRRRESLFVIGVDCVTSAPTCFCTSLGGGPKVREGVDLALTEVVNSNEHFFLIRVGTTRGENLLRQLKLVVAESSQIDEAERRIEHTRKSVASQGQVDLKRVREDLLANWNHRHWEELGNKCLACANCTLVCPTCFCSNTVEEVSLEGDRVERFRQWDSCFTANHGYIHGGQIRPDVTSRYRQWLTHKLATWQDQFGEVGCTGCGRCVVWCPVGIDLRQEVQALTQPEGEA
jgi:ferredoxin